MSIDTLAPAFGGIEVTLVTSLPDHDLSSPVIQHSGTANTPMRHYFVFPGGAT